MGLIHQFKDDTVTVRIIPPHACEITPEITEACVIRAQSFALEPPVVVDVDNATGVGAEPKALLNKSGKRQESVSVSYQIRYQTSGRSPRESDPL